MPDTSPNNQNDANQDAGLSGWAMRLACGVVGLNTIERLVLAARLVGWVSLPGSDRANWPARQEVVELVMRCEPYAGDPVQAALAWELFLQGHWRGPARGLSLTGERGPELIWPANTNLGAGGSNV